MFSKWKGLVRRSEVRNEYELPLAIQIFSMLISHQDCNNFYRNMLGYLPRCIRRETIIE
ncbi:hypothetical protein H311_01538 [Anncaliia algerae PRA109]|nr:hypothetical protein H311_01538 [Anncaliia algerae PRA109]